MARLEALERRINDGSTSSAKSESGFLQLVMDMRKEDAKRHEDELRRREKQEESALQARQSPMFDWIKQQADAHERERKAEAERQKAFHDQQAVMQKATLDQQKMFMEMQLKAADERATRFLEELKEVRAEKKKEPDLVKQVETLAALRDALDGIGGGDDDDSFGSKLLKTLPEILPARTSGR